MTAFFTRCWKNIDRLLVGVFFVACAGMAQAAGIEPARAALTAGDEGHVLNAHFAIDLGPRFEDAVTRGVPLIFNLEVVIERPRPYWIAEHVATRVQSFRLSYSSLTRQYRLSSGALHQNVGSLNEALHLLGRVVDWAVTERGALKAGENYLVALRLALDRSQLPKPFQVDAITDKDWRVEAKTLRWMYAP